MIDIRDELIARACERLRRACERLRHPCLAATARDRRCQVIVETVRPGAGPGVNSRLGNPPYLTDAGIAGRGVVIAAARNQDEPRYGQ